MSGTYPNPTVAKINGVTLGTTTATSGHLLVANGSAWQSVAMSGDATLVASGALTLANSGASAGTYGDAADVPVVTVDAKGRVTTITTTPIIIANIGTNTRKFCAVEILGLGNTSAVGIGSNTNGTVGTVSQVTDSSGAYLNYLTSNVISSLGGWTSVSPAQTALELLPDFTFVFKTGANATDVNTTAMFCIGLSNSIASSFNTTTPSKTLAFVYDNVNKSDSEWKIVTADDTGTLAGSTRTATGLGVPTVSTRYVFRIVATSTSNVDFYANGTKLASVSATLPGVATTLQPVLAISNGAATGRNLLISFWKGTTL